MHCIHISIWNMLSKASCKLLRSWKLFSATQRPLEKKMVNPKPASSLSKIGNNQFHEDWRLVSSLKINKCIQIGSKTYEACSPKFAFDLHWRNSVSASVCLPRCDETRGLCKVKRRRPGILTDGSMRVEDFVSNLFGGWLLSPTSESPKLPGFL